jgi:hypothetical protein
VLLDVGGRALAAVALPFLLFGASAPLLGLYGLGWHPQAGVAAACVVVSVASIVVCGAMLCRDYSGKAAVTLWLSTLAGVIGVYVLLVLIVSD